MDTTFGVKAIEESNNMYIMIDIGLKKGGDYIGGA